MTTEYYEKEDIAEKIKVVKNIISAVKKEDGTTTKSFAEKFKELTGWVLNDTVAKTHEISYRNLYKCKERSKLIDIQKIRDKLNKWYLVDQKPPYAYQIIYFGKLLKDQITFFDLAYYGFIWKQIPGTKKAIFIESSERISQRIYYLLKMMHHRDAGKNLVYLNVDYVTNYVEAVSVKRGVIYENKNKKNKKTYKECFLDILEIVNEPCVFVYPQLMQKKMSPFSTKKNLMTCLMDRGIPYNPKSHRLELYEMVKRFDKNKVDEVAQIFVSAGSECVARPSSCGDPLNIFSFLKRGRKLKWASKQHDWKQLEKKLIMNENKMYKEDKMMETVIDKILTHGRYGGTTPDFLTDYSEVMKYDLEFGPANAFID